MTVERARGALLGLAVGDALGTTYEFATIRQPAYPALATGPATDVVGGGPFAVPPGAITDDTQLAVCLARSLAERRALDPADLAARYVAWTDEAFDIGFQTRSALGHAEDGTPEPGLAAWRDSGHGGAGNGSLMRTAPIGVAFSRVGGLAGDVIDAAIADSLVTHADPRCVLACAVYDHAIARAIDDGLTGVAMLEAARAALAPSAERLHQRWAQHPDAERARIDAAVADLHRDLEHAGAAEPAVYGDEMHLHDTAGFVRLALRLAFWHCAHTPSWQAALVDVASRGGDADTNGAIVGGLLGARDGEAAIPDAWRARVLAATQRGSARWGEAHHPRHLLALVK